VFRILSALLFCTLSALPAFAQTPKALRLFVEAEDFTVERGTWKVLPYRENYFVSPFAVTFLSRMGCLSAPEQVPAKEPATATTMIDLPRDGEFTVMARYEQPFQYSAEFTLAIEQNGKEVFRQTFGKLESPKIWAFNNHQRVAMERFSWGGTDNLVWQDNGKVKLSKGQAKLTLIAAEQQLNGKPQPFAAKRNVDLICLTDDTAGMEAQKKTRYLPYDGWLTLDGDLFVRVTNPKNATTPIIPVLNPFDLGQHSPYYVHIRDWPGLKVLKSGYILDDKPYQIAGPRSQQVKPEALAKPLDAKSFAKEIPDAEYLKPGDTSGWVPLGQALDALNNCKWFPIVQSKEKGAVVLNLDLEFGIPDGKGGIRGIKKVHVENDAMKKTFEMPANINPNAELAKALKERYWLPEIRTQKEALDWLNSEVAKFPKIGKTPERFLIYNLLGFGGGLSSPEGRQLALALGDNTSVNAQGKKRDLVCHWPDPKVPAIQKQESTRKDGFKDLSIVSYGDEMHLPALPITDAELTEYLKTRGVKVDGPVVVAKAKTDPLYYYTRLAMKDKGAKLYAEGTAFYKSKGVLTGTNYSPHANYLVTEMDYIRPFKLKALSMPWSEDYIWQIPEFSVQIMGYLTGGLRAGAKYDNLPIHMYVMPHTPGNTPRGFRLSYYTAIGHGAKMINYFCASPLAVGATENYMDTNDLGMWKEVHRCTHEAGIFENYVMDGNPRPAKVAFLLSSVDEVLTDVNNFALALHNNERKALYHALRQAQVPVDFISEDDLIEGRAKEYHTIYVTQQHLHSQGIAALTKWITAGGTAIAHIGGGFTNEMQKPNPATNALFGIKDQSISIDPNLVKKHLLKENQPFFFKQDLPHVEPIDTATWANQKVPVLVWKQKLVPSDGKVIATFADGSAAGVEKLHGKGKAVLLGFLPGQSYVKSALPIPARPADRGGVNEAMSHFIPTNVDAKLRAAMVDAYLPKEYTRPVSCSVQLVEPTLIDTPAKGGKPARIAVSLANFSGAPVKELVVTIPGVKGVTAVRSVEHAQVKHAITPEGLTITLPLDVADMLLIDLK